MTQHRTIVRGHRGGPAPWAGAAALILCACSAGTRTPPPPTHPEVVEIEVVPSVVAVSSDVTNPTRFVLEVRLWDRVWNKPSAIPESAGLTVNWSVDPATAGLHLVGDPHGYRATLELDPKVTLTSPVTVKAQAGTLSAESQIVPAVAGQDQVQTSYTAEMAPDAVIVRGIRGTQPCSVWLAPSLTRTGDAGDIDAECTGGDAWAVALLDPAHGAQFFDAKWAGTQVVTATTTPALRSVPIAFRVLMGGSATDLAARQADARSFALTEMDDADTVFKDSRVGIDLNVADDQIVMAPADKTTVTNCIDGNRTTMGSDYVPSGVPPMLHVYVVDDMGGTDGFTCPATSLRPYPVIYLRAARESGTILVHELGHALGLDLPGAGHSDDMSHFDAANVMVGGYAWDKVWRRRFTVGQVFRITAEKGSWLNWGQDLISGGPLRDPGQARLACQCGFDDPAGRCPRLVDDVAKPRGSVGKMVPWQCSDVVRVVPEATGDEPMALIAGRLWGSPPDLTACRRDHVGKPLSVPTTPGHSADYVQFENVTGPGDCASWVAIFLRDHQPVWSDLTSVGGVWSDAADLRPLDPTLVDRKPVTVHVYYNAADAIQAGNEIVDANLVYGTANRTGIDLTLAPEQDACPPSPPIDEPWVCYSSGGHTVAQLVGHELGIPYLSTAQENDPAFIDNAFLTTTTPGTKLTLGQVFQIHVKLGTPGFDCSDPTSWCNDPKSWPPLEAGVQP